MKKLELKQLIREEIRRVMSEANKNDTLSLTISFRATGKGTFYKDPIFQGPYKGPSTFNIRSVRSGDTTEDSLYIIPAMSLNSFSIGAWLVPGNEQDVYGRIIKLLDNWFKTIKNDVIVYDDERGMTVTFANANDLKKQVMDAMKANWKSTWAAKSPKFNLQ